MVTQWLMHGEKQGKNVGMIWGFDHESRILTVNFAILSVSQVESEVKRTVCKVFGLPEYSPFVEFILPPSVSAMQFVTGGIANIDRLLSDQLASVFVISTAF